MYTETFPCASVIIVGYNSRGHLTDCLAAVINQTYPVPFEVVFVDNASTDHSVEFVRDQFPTVRVIETGANLGYAGGNNAGARLATGEVLAFLNPDTIVAYDWLYELMRPFLADASVGLTTSKITLMSNPGTINACGNDISLAGVATCRRAGQRGDQVVVDEEVTAVSGAAFAIKTSIFEHLGGFDEAFWMYVEDTDLSWRARRAGYQCILAAHSVARHDYKFALSPEKVGQIERNRYRMLVKNLNLSTVLLLLPTLVLWELAGLGWAMLNGPRYIQAKLGALMWALGNLPKLLERRQTHQLRSVSDLHVIQTHSIVPPVTTMAGGMVSRLVVPIIVPLSYLAALPIWLSVVALRVLKITNLDLHSATTIATGE